MPFRASFDCLWCGRAHRPRSEDDLEGWAALCPDCVGRAGENGFLRYRLRAALAERGSAGSMGVTSGPAKAATAAPTTIESDPDAETKAYYAARAPEYDDWYLRRGRYTRGPVLDLPWHQELDQVTQWLDGLPLHGEIVELAAGTGWWSPLLAQKGTLSIHDINPEPLDLARERLVAHGLRAHIHVRDAWGEPDQAVDALFCGFWLSHLARDRLDGFLALVGRWLKPNGIFCFIDSLPDRESGAVDHPLPSGDDLAIRRLSDGREFRIRKVFHSLDRLRDGLSDAGFAAVEVRRTDRFFLMGSAVR